MLSVKQARETFSRDLKSFTSDLQSSCSDLRKAVSRPLTIGTSREDYTKWVARDFRGHCNTLATELQLLERLTTETISFEELLGHCNALHSCNQAGILELEKHLQAYGYKSGFTELPLEQKLDSPRSPNQEQQLTLYDSPIKSDMNNFTPTRTSSVINTQSEVYNGNLKRAFDSNTSLPEALTSPIPKSAPNVEESICSTPETPMLTLESLGISAASLAAIGSAALDNGRQIESGSSTDQPSSELARDPPLYTEPIKTGETIPNSHASAPLETHKPTHRSLNYDDDNIPIKPSSFPSSDNIPMSKPKVLGTNVVGVLREVVAEEMERAPAFMRKTVTLQQLNDAIAKINDHLGSSLPSNGKENVHNALLSFDTIDKLELGTSTKSIINFLVSLTRLKREYSNGETLYSLTT